MKIVHPKIHAVALCWKYLEIHLYGDGDTLSFHICSPVFWINIGFMEWEVIGEFLIPLAFNCRLHYLSQEWTDETYSNEITVFRPGIELSVTVLGFTVEIELGKLHDFPFWGRDEK
jgi:hypothetical protein